MKRLIKARKGDNNRQSAILYVSGEIYEGQGHNNCVQNFINNHKDIKQLISDAYKEKNLDITEDDIEYEFIQIIDGEGLSPIISDSETMKNNVDKMSKFLPENFQMGFAHKVGDGIYLDTDSDVSYNFRSGKEVNVDEIASALKNHYPDYTIYDNCHRHEDGGYEKIAKRLINANYAYNFVEKRVNLLLDKNKDMSSDEAYGIAWNQWKKDHPKWVGKTERNKKKRLNNK